MKKIALAALGLLLALAPAHADSTQSDSNILDKVINVPSVKAWVTQGLPTNPQPRNDDTVQGGIAIRIAVPDKGVNPWDIAARSAIIKPVQSGDVLFVMFWAKAEVPVEGQQTAVIPAIRIEENSVPYTAVAQDSANITGTWATYYASGVAAKDYKSGALTLTLQLAAAKQTIDLGPVFVVDLGPGYDISKLPRNTLAAAPAASPPVSLAAAESRFADELARIRALLPVHGQLMNDPSVTSVSAYGTNQTSQLVPASEVPGGQALRVSVEKGGGDTFATGTSSNVYGDIRKGDVIFIAYYARATEVSNEAQSGVISAMNVQQNASPWTVAAGSAALAPLNSWRLFYAYGVSSLDIPSGGAMLTAQIGANRQTIEFGPAFVLNLGPDVNLSSLPANKIDYQGREPNAPWRAAAAARIKQYRTGDLRVVVTDADGKPVPGAAVHVAMQRQLFHFGSFVGMNFANAGGPDADKTRQSFVETFNFATSPIYWSDWAWADPAMREKFIASMQWLHDHGYAFRGHPVIYPREDLTPSDIKKLAGDPAAVKKAVLDHVREVVPIAARYGACCLDVVNEPRDGTYLPSIAGDDIFTEAYRTAHEVAPDVKLFVNDYGIIVGGGRNENNLSFYHHWIEDMLAKGVPLGGIGIQGHFGADLTDPTRVVEVLDDFSRYRLPIEITEFDVDTTDEEAQADYTRDMLTVAFSEPAVDAFVIWGWWQGDHWKPDGAMLRKDWSEKPNYRVWQKLIHHDWWTDESGTAGADGAFATRAYYGDYKLTVSGGGRSVVRDVSFGPGSAEFPVVLK
jgi:hypothetical protein